MIQTLDFNQTITSGQFRTSMTWLGRIIDYQRPSMAEQLIQKNPISPRSTSPAIPDHQLSQKPIRHQKLSKVNQIWTWVGFFNRNNISQNNEEFVGAIVLGRTNVTIYWISTTSPRTELQRPPKHNFHMHIRVNFQWTVKLPWNQKFYYLKEKHTNRSTFDQT